MHLAVLPHLQIFAARDYLLLWGRFLGVPSGSGGLAIRLPPWDAPATTAENRHHSLRLCRTVGQPIVAACFQPANSGCEDSRTTRKSRLKGGCGQDCPPH
jgi:hypothetical protein